MQAKSFIQSILLCNSGAMAAETAHEWAEVFSSNNLDEFDCENRGGKYSAKFYDFFPVKISRNPYKCLQKPLQNHIKLAIGCPLDFPCLITDLAIFSVSYLEN